VISRSGLNFAERPTRAPDGDPRARWRHPQLHPQCGGYAAPSTEAAHWTEAQPRSPLKFSTFEIEAIRRAWRIDIAGKPVNVVTPEDLVLMKILSERPRDVADAEAIVRRRRQELDRDYLEPRIKEFADALEKPEILNRWRRWTSR
jgi:hypothetical protein